MRSESKAWLGIDRGEEFICRGVWGSGGASFALGKLFFCRRGSSWAEGDIVCVFDSFEYAGPLFSPSGVVISAGAASSALISFLSKTGIPYLIIKEPFSEEYAGKVALLDTERDLLIIDPCIDTLNDYAQQKKTLGRAAELLAAERGMIVGKKRGGALITPEGDGDIYDFLVSAAERFCPRPITVSLKVPAASSEEIFCDRAEALMRAAVYGNFSLCLEGYRGADDISSALSLLGRVFCSLSKEGREFNGYLRRGILIDAPLWLSSPSPLAKSDFICYDLDRLTSRLLGCKIEDARVVDASSSALIKVWSSYFSRYAPACHLQAKSKLLTDSAFFREWSELASIEELYLE